MMLAPVTCAARRCRVVVQRGMLMCEPHWMSLPTGLRRSIHITSRRRLGRDHLELVDRARDIIERTESDRRLDTVAFLPDGTAVAYQGRRL